MSTGSVDSSELIAALESMRCDLLKYLRAVDQRIRRLKSKQAADAYEAKVRAREKAQ